jgi:aminoglycoside 3-N-acetyltransferase I
MTSSPIVIRRLGTQDLELLRELNALFATVFEDPDSYSAEPPSDSYLEGLLAKEHFTAVVALLDDEVIGGLVAYELEKFEKVRREYYIYDLAVRREHRRRYIATQLIEHLCVIASSRGAWVILVQADYGDDPAISLYEKLGTREEVLHFDIDPNIAKA